MIHGALGERDRRPINVTVQVHSTYNIRLGRAKAGDSGASHCFVSAKSSAWNSVSVLIFLLTGCAFNAKGVSAAPLGSPACLSGSAMIHDDVLRLRNNLLEVLSAFRVFKPNPLFHVLKTWFESKCEERLLWNWAEEYKVSLTEAPLKMTGGGCHDTLTPLSLPNPASSGHAGILTGAVAWDTDERSRRRGRGGSTQQKTRVRQAKQSVKQIKINHQLSLSAQPSLKIDLNDVTTSARATTYLTRKHKSNTQRHFGRERGACQFPRQRKAQSRHCEVGCTEQIKVGEVHHTANKTRGEVTVPSLCIRLMCRNRKVSNRYGLEPLRKAGFNMQHVRLFRMCSSDWRHFSTSKDILHSVPLSTTVKMTKVPSPWF